MGGNLQILHKVCPYTQRGTHQGNNFAYLNDVQGRDTEVVPFQQELLTMLDKVVTLFTMERIKKDHHSNLNVLSFSIAFVCTGTKPPSQASHTYCILIPVIASLGLELKVIMLQLLSKVILIWVYHLPYICLTSTTIVVNLSSISCSQY